MDDHSNEEDLNDSDDESGDAGPVDMSKDKERDPTSKGMEKSRQHTGTNDYEDNMKHWSPFFALRLVSPPFPTSTWVIHLDMPAYSKYMFNAYGFSSPCSGKATIIIISPESVTAMGYRNLAMYCKRTIRGSKAYEGPAGLKDKESVIKHARYYLGPRWLVYKLGQCFLPVSVQLAINDDVYNPDKLQESVARSKRMAEQLQLRKALQDQIAKLDAEMGLGQRDA
jgi:hypothetical protein